MSSTRPRTSVLRIAASLTSGVAFGCFGIVAEMVPAFVAEKATGAPLADSLVGALVVFGGLTGFLWAFRAAWRDVGAQSQVGDSQRSRRNRRHANPNTGPPPWDAPRFVDWLGKDDYRDPLIARLDLITLPHHDPIATRCTFFRDRYTGQLWRGEDREQGFGSGTAYVPIAESDLPSRRPGEGN